MQISVLQRMDCNRCLCEPPHVFPGLTLVASYGYGEQLYAGFNSLYIDSDFLKPLKESGHFMSLFLPSSFFDTVFGHKLELTHILLRSMGVLTLWS